MNDQLTRWFCDCASKSFFVSKAKDSLEFVCVCLREKKRERERQTKRKMVNNNAYKSMNDQLTKWFCDCAFKSSFVSRGITYTVTI